MSLEDKIKEIFRGSTKVDEELQVSPDDQPNTYELYNYLSKAGYRLLELIPQENSDIPEVLLEPKIKNHLYPEITHIVKENKFYINVVKHGMLDTIDLEKVIQGYQNASAVVNYLKTLDLARLEVRNGR